MIETTLTTSKSNYQQKQSGKKQSKAKRLEKYEEFGIGVKGNAATETVKRLLPPPLSALLNIIQCFSIEEASSELALS